MFPERRERDAIGNACGFSAQGKPMETAFNASLVLLTILYTVLMSSYARIFARGPAGVALLVRPILVGTVSLHFLSVLIRGIAIGACPLGSRAEFMSLVALSVAVNYVIVEIRLGERATGIFAITPAFLLQVMATVSILGAEKLPVSPLGAFQSVHSLAAIVGLSAVALSNVYAILYLFLYTAIKRGRFGLFYRKMPPLETLSDLNFVTTSGAFFALSIVIGMGAWRAFDGSPDTDISLAQPEVILTSLLWILFGASIFAKRFLRLGGKRFAYTTLLGLLLLVGIFVGGLFAPGFHG